MSVPDISTCRLICRVFLSTFSQPCVCGACHAACVAGGGLAADRPGPSQGSHFCKNTFLVLIFSFSPSATTVSCSQPHTSIMHSVQKTLRFAMMALLSQHRNIPLLASCQGSIAFAAPRSANPCSMLPPRTCVPDTPNACSIVLILFPVQEVGGVHRVFSVYAHCGEMLRNISNLHVRFCTCTCC